MRVLLCLDGSETSNAAIPVARMLAAAPGSQVIVARVVHAEPPAAGVSAAGDGSMVAFGGAAAADLHRIAAQRRWEADQAAYQADLEQALAIARAECEAHLPELPKETTLHVAATAGDIAQSLIDTARAEKVDVIVMATHSRPPMKELFMGSVARAVVASGVAPVTLVHPRA